MAILVREAPMRVSFDELSARTREEQQVDAEALAQFLFEASTGRFVNLHAHQPASTREPGERPVAFGPTRLQALAGKRVTNVYHRVVELNERWTRELLGRCDGTRGYSELVRELELEVAAANEQNDRAWLAIKKDTREVVRQLARRGLVVA